MHVAQPREHVGRCVGGPFNIARLADHRNTNFRLSSGAQYKHSNLIPFSKTGAGVVVSRMGLQKGQKPPKIMKRFNRRTKKEPQRSVCGLWRAGGGCLFDCHLNRRAHRRAIRLVRAVGKLGCQFVLARRQGDHGFGLARAKVFVLFVKWH